MLLPVVGKYENESNLRVANAAALNETSESRRAEITVNDTRSDRLKQMIETCKYGVLFMSINALISFIDVDVLFAVSVDVGLWFIL